METFMSQKGKEIGVFAGYRYRQDRRNADGSVSWRCLETNCTGRMKIFTDGQMREITKHENAPNVAKRDSERVRSSIRDRAASTVEKPRQIVMQCTNALSAEAAILMPRYTATQRAIERKRKRAEVPLPMPRSLADITIPDNLAVTSRNDNFVLCDSGDDDAHRMFVFGTDRNLELLEEHADWFMDGTFISSVAKPLAQSTGRSSGLVDLYRNDEEVRLYTKMLLALAFVPAADVLHVLMNWLIVVLMSYRLCMITGKTFT